LSKSPRAMNDQGRPVQPQPREGEFPVGVRAWRRPSASSNRWHSRGSARGFHRTGSFGPDGQ
jgi:hypothetical protein